ncbi:MAG: heme-binding protein [Caulobacteraceae bacterium]
MRPSLIAALASVAVAGAASLSSAWAQAPAAPAAAAAPATPTYTAYGPNITLEQAMQVANAANAEAARRKLPATIAIVDTSGALVYYQRGDQRPGQPPRPSPPARPSPP